MGKVEFNNNRRNNEKKQDNEKKEIYCLRGIARGTSVSTTSTASLLRAVGAIPIAATTLLLVLLVATLLLPRHLLPFLQT